MNGLIKILIIFSILILSSISVFAVGINNQFDNLNSGNIKNAGTQDGKNKALNKLSNPSRDKFITTLKQGEGGIKYLLIRVAKDLKTIFYIIAGVYLLIMIVRILLNDNTEEEIDKFKKGVTWVTIGIILMQITYTFVTVIYDKSIGEQLGYNLIDKIINPIITLLETATSFFFLAIAIYAFFRIVTADGDEEKIKTGKKSIMYAIVGFFVIKFSKQIVEATYGTLNPACQNSFGLNFISGSCLQDARISGFSGIAIQSINWMNGFIGIIMLIMIIYAGSLVLLSAGDEEKLKKAKSIILYVIVGMVVLVFNYLILTFFLIPERVI